MKKLFCAEKEFGNHGLSQAKCDSTGRLYVGKYSSRLCDPKVGNDCNLYSYDKYQGLQKVATDMKAANGMAWFNNCFYHIDSCTRSIAGYKWDSHSGKLCELRVL